ncbi:DoxX family protein [Rhodococcus sp. 14-2470-1a]|uniref:DoxX family protein n=1 Tax=Rhodococcus sp. 14-2470-1a TaxID=2023150 RepID=UPI000B9C1553|nr:DoxX family protein [Rhodococcus sp. 14-2470-1a]OZF45787.1 DoxX family protein [Rhodococcus sp. 14-2470-1a]
MAFSKLRQRPTSRDVVAPLMLRSLIGATMIAHGVKHGRSIDGTAGWFGSIGFRQPRLQAQASAVVETAAGAALVVGLGTPVAAAAVVATMAVAAKSVHVENGFFITSEGWEYVANLAVAATALAALGPGRLSLDRALGWDGAVRGDRAVAFVSALGVGAAAAQLALFHRPASS